jgi:copper resistance protein D
VDDALVVSRALHFTATVLLVGVVFFRALIDGHEQQGLDAYRRQLRLIFWLSLGLAFASGAAWLMAVGASIDDASWSQSLADGTANTVLTDTQFGQAWLARLAAGVLLAALVLFSKAAGLLKRSLELTLAAAFAGGVAFGGHAVGTPGPAGAVHLAGDILHIIAASAWVGGLLPYGLYLRAMSDLLSKNSRRSVQDTTHRFSNLGVVSVLTILITGILNTVNLVGSAHALVYTDYGRTLMTKVTLFFAMVAIASINRIVLTPRIPDRDAINALRRNSLIEASLGLAILCIVAALGTMPPASVDHSGMHH